MTSYDHDRTLNDAEIALLADIDKYGWHSTSVFDPEGEKPSFNYSIGFTKTLKSPEFIIFGLPHELMHSMLWELFEQLRGGLESTDGQPVSDLIDGFDCVLRKVNAEAVIPDYLNSAIWFWQHCGNMGLPPVFQIVWPGKLDGLFPWDEGCSDYVREIQPNLWDPRPATD